jgi:sigma-B regulation protein RsbU (phosphoserine phosphatase)
MKILLAEDDPVTRLMVQAALQEWGFDVAACENGQATWDTLQKPDAPNLALLDWLMPGIDGLEICRRMRNEPKLSSAYVILLTARNSREDVITGLQAGADDYVAKPFDREELRLRLRAGERILNLQSNLAARVSDLQDALNRVKMLQGIIPICSYCKKVRTDPGYWQQVEAYIASQIDVRFSHGICPDCYEMQVKPELERMNRPLPPYPSN